MSWLSGPCRDDDEGGVFIVFEDRAEDESKDPVVSDSGRVVWVDSGSGPGFEMLMPGGDETER